MHNVLAALKLTHFLCYGSLWGQIRLSRSLPWESNVEFCVFNEELITKDEVYLQRVFKQHQLLLSYDSSEGLYSIMDPKIGGALVELVVFEENPQVPVEIYLTIFHQDSLCRVTNELSVQWIGSELIYRISQNNWIKKLFHQFSERNVTVKH